MVTKIRNIIDWQIIKIQRNKFRKKLQQIQRKDFSIISSNCIGGTLYQLLDLPYTTPTIGLFFFPQCFLKLISNLHYYLDQDLVPVDVSIYPLGNYKRAKYGFYPIGKLADIEIHFMHYSSWEEVIQKWTRRVKRVNFDNLFFIFTDQNLCSYEDLKTFDQFPYPKKVCFTAKKYDLSSCVQIPYYEKNDEVGNLTAYYHLFNNRFDFVKWFDEPIDMNTEIDSKGLRFQGQ